MITEFCAGHATEKEGLLSSGTLPATTGWSRWLSLIHEHDLWCLDQIKGIENTDVMNQEQIYFDGDQIITDLSRTDLYYAGMELVEIYRQASDHKCRHSNL